MSMTMSKNLAPERVCQVQYPMHALQVKQALCPRTAYCRVNRQSNSSGKRINDISEVDIGLRLECDQRTGGVGDTAKFVVVMEVKYGICKNSMIECGMRQLYRIS